MSDVCIGATEVPVVCARLRAKGAGVVYGQRVGFEAGFVPTATFWCLETADPVGPDDGFVHPHVCVSARRCFLDNRRAAQGSGASENE